MKVINFMDKNMKKIPDIVKELREYEKSGKLKYKNNSSYDKLLHINEYSFDGIVSVPICFFFISKMLVSP